MDGVIAMAILISFITMVVGLALLLPFAAFRPSRHLAPRLIVGGLGAFSIALAFLPKLPAANAAPSDLAPGVIFHADPSQAPSGLTSDPAEHNYSEKSGSTYYYVGNLSNYAAEMGRSAAPAYGFIYMGRVDPSSPNRETVMAVDSMGGAKYYAACVTPCSIIHLSDGQNIVYDPGSIIGAVFQDVMNGQLEKEGGNVIHQPASPGRIAPSEIYHSQ